MMPEGAAKTQNLAVEAPGPEIIESQLEVNRKMMMPVGTAKSKNLAVEVPGPEIIDS